MLRFGHGRVELPRDRRRRLSGPEDHLPVGGGEGSAGNPGARQSLQTRSSGGIFYFLPVHESSVFQLVTCCVPSAKSEPVLLTWRCHQ